MARNDSPNGPGLQNLQLNNLLDKPVTYKLGLCSNCGGGLEPVGNRMFMMYKRAHLPQPRAEAQVCSHCGWVENDPHFQALLEEYLKHH